MDSVEVDLDHNGIAELTLSSRGDFTVMTSGPTNVAGIPQPPPDLGAWASPFEYGSRIHSLLPDGIVWTSGRAGLISCRDVGCIGLWQEVGVHYLGVEFEFDGNTHYGWVEIEIPFLLGGGVLRRYAFESEPGREIVAGFVPEPKVGALAMISISVLLGRRRLKRN